MPVLPRSLEIQGEIAAIRRDIHAHPELAYEETRTSDIVAAKLTEWGLEVTRGLGRDRCGWNPAQRQLVEIHWPSRRHGCAPNGRSQRFPAPFAEQRPHACLRP